MEKLTATPEITKHIGLKIREARKEQKMRQAALAEIIKMSRASVANIELGNQALPIDKLYVVAYVLGKEVGYFLPEMNGDSILTKLTESKIHPRLLRKLEKIPSRSLLKIIAIYRIIKS